MSREGLSTPWLAVTAPTQGVGVVALRNVILQVTE